MTSPEPGAAIEPLSVTPARYLTVRYAGASGDFNPIHIDEQFAQQVGLPGRILHGLYTMAQVARAVSDAGGGPQSLRSLSVQFRGMGVPEQELTVTGSVASIETSTSSTTFNAPNSAECGLIFQSDCLMTAEASSL